MKSYLPVEFLQEKISTLRTALFFSMPASVLKFPVSVINVLKVDEAGQIWFCMPAPLQSVKEFDDEFCSTLQFFRKKENFYLRIHGKAFIVSGPEQLSGIYFVSNDIKKDILHGRLVLIKVQIQCADYFERKQPTEKIEWRKIPAQLYNMFFRAYEASGKPQRIFNLSQ